jgi:hypothetical protein
MRALPVLLVVIFVSAFMLFYIFNQLERLSMECREGSGMPICQVFAGFGIHVFVVLLLVCGFNLVIIGAAFVLYTVLRQYAGKGSSS